MTAASGPCTGFPAPGLRPVRRFITSHTEDGDGYFKCTDGGDHFRVMQNGIAAANIIYSTSCTPAKLAKDFDIDEAAKREPPLHYKNGSVVRMVDFAPGAESPLHRALSIDYGVVIEGELELTLDSGDSRVMKKGDVSVNRAVAHKWRNISNTEAARMLYILLDIEPLMVNGKALDEFLGALEIDYVGR